MTLNTEQVVLLNAPLTRDQVATRQAGKGRQVAYLEGFEAIRQANRIFGHGGWGMTVDDLQFQAMSNGGFYRATVTVTVAGCEPQQDVGGCVAQNDTADQHDMAFKGAVTDAMKRALRHYGAAFGNDLYGDDVPAPAAAQSQQTTRQQAQRTVTVHAPTSDPDTALRAQVRLMAQHDEEGRSKLPKPIDAMNAVELEKTRDWLQKRAAAIAKGQTTWVDPHKPLRVAGWDGVGDMAPEALEALRTLILNLLDGDLDMQGIYAAQGITVAEMDEDEAAREFALLKERAERRAQKAVAP